ncbi:LPS biosynthesis protein [Paenibacillus lautus]|nr:LPS biosynthesis protein [Paenibacillus lautus]
MLVLQTVAFSVTGYADSAPSDSGAATVSEADSPSADEPPSVTEAVYDAPNNFLVMAAAPTDKTAVLANANPTFNLTVKQGDPAAVIPAGGEINGRDNFTLELADIAVPTQGDNPSAPPETVIQQGDYAILDKATYFPDVSLTPAGPMAINQGSQKIATVQFFADSIKIMFDGAVYDGSRRDVKIGFSANAKAADQSPGGGGNTTIFGDGFKFTNSPLVPEYRIWTGSQSLSGHYSWISGAAFQEGAVAWRVMVASNDKDDPTIQMKLDNLTVVDSLTNAGPYVAGSFKLYKAKTTVDANGNIKQETAPVEVPGAGEPVIDPVNGTLTYTLPDGFGDSAAYLDFKTWIPKSKWYNEFDGTNGAAVGTNDSRNVAVNTSATLLAEDGTTTLAGPLGASAALTPDWIQQSGKVDSGGLITWTITVNARNYHRANTPIAGLKNVTITDTLPEGTAFVSANYTVNGVDKGSITPVGNVFNIGDADGPIQLTIVSKITDSSKSKFTNVPRANWELASPAAGVDWNNDAVGVAPNGVTATTEVIVGAHAFTKGVTTNNATAYALYNVAGARWTINLTLQYDLDNPIVYDLLVHGGSLDVLDNVDANPNVTPETLAAIKSKIDGKQLWQKYREGSLTKSNGLTGDVIPLTVNGERVADLIKVTGYKGDVPGSISFESVTTNPDNLFRQDNGGNWSNRGLFFDGDDYMSHQDATARNPVRMLNKEMLYASTVDENGNALGNIAADWNRNYGNWSASTWTRAFVVNDPNWYMDNSRDDKYILAGYDRKDRTVTFRLAVNMPGFKTEEMAKDGGTRVASDIKLVDTLPEGWEFVDYAPGEAYRLYKGATGYNTGSGPSAGGYGRYAQALTNGVIQPNAPEHVVSFTKNGNVGTFTFSKLESPYVILVKARPTNAKMATYQIGNNNAGENQAEFSMKWGDKPYSATEKHRIIVHVQSLSKTVKKPVSGVQEWTVNYTPPFEMKPGVYLLDTLAKGLKLRKDANGNLSLTHSDIAVYPGEMKADGTLQRAGQPLNLADPNSEVKVTAGTDQATGGSTLRFDFADPNKLYQIVYQTESQGMQPGVAGNSITLMGDDTLPPIGAQSSITLDANDVAGSANENGLLYLLKVGPDGTTPLKDVKFQLFNPDDTPAEDKDGNVMGEKITGSDGKTSFIIQMPGDYLLKQTYIDPDTYLPTTTVYQVRVIDAPGKPVLVDGQKVDSNNPLKVPTPAQGKLTISNKVEGNGSDPGKVFEYTVNFDGEGKDGEYVYKKSVDAINVNKITNGYKIFLKHGESVTFPTLPADLVYTVTEADYTTVDGYTTVPGTRELSDKVVYEGDHKADFVNKRYVSNLTVSNTVMGNGGDKTKAFEYTILFEETGKDGGYAYEKSDGSTGTIKSGQSFTLKDGETLEIVGLPKDLKYTVTQKDYTTDEYVTTPKERQYTGVMVGNDEVAPFTNVRVIEGGLLISNTVKGKDDDKSKPFQYTLTFTGEGSDKSYAYEKSDGSKGTITSGDTFELTDGQTIVIEGLPTYLQYEVTQDDYTQDGYVTDPESFVRTGTIPEKKVAEAHFVNTRPYLEGVLRDNNTGEVIPNAEIIVTNKKTNEQQKIWTNEQGEYFVPAEADTDYTITYTKVYQVGAKDVPVEFTQKAKVDGSVTDETVPADITAVGIVLFKQLDGTTALFNNSFTSQMHIYLKDKDGNYIQENGRPKAFPMASNGTFSVEGLSEQKYTMEVRYKAETGEELLLKVTQLDVKANGELNISEELVDPYGTVYDETTGDAHTGKKIAGAKVTLYYADTKRNRDKGLTPDTKVTLPSVPNFGPHDNKSPEQDSDANGFYAYMVFPEADYYLIVTKDGYETHRSDTISVDFDIVKYDVPMKPINTGGGPGPINPAPEPENPGPVNPTPEPENPGPVNPTPEPENPGPVNPTPEPENPGPVNPTPEPENPGPVNPTPEPENPGPVSPAPEPENPGPVNPAPEPENPGPVPDQPGSEPGNVNNGNNNIDNVPDVSDLADKGAGNGNNELDDAPETGDNSVSPIFYMALALMSLMTIGFCLLGNKKKKHIQ